MCMSVYLPEPDRLIAAVNAVARRSPRTRRRACDRPAQAACGWPELTDSSLSRHRAGRRPSCG